MHAKIQLADGHGGCEYQQLTRRLGDRAVNPWQNLHQYAFDVKTEFCLNRRRLRSQRRSILPILAGQKRYVLYS
jgi:hypothetical protein